jgi:hypothetical protein
MPLPFTLYAHADDAKNGVAPIFTIPGVAPKDAVKLTEEKQEHVALVDSPLAAYPYSFPPRFTGVEGMPPKETIDGKVVIVPMLVGDFLGRSPLETRHKYGVRHVVGPNTGPGAVRTATGTIAGTTGIIVYV